jgi:hypothetical protein
MARKKELDLRLRIRVGEDIALGPGKADPPRGRWACPIAAPGCWSKP